MMTNLTLAYESFPVYFTLSEESAWLKHVTEDTEENASPYSRLEYTSKRLVHVKSNYLFPLSKTDV